MAIFRAQPFFAKQQQQQQQQQQQKNKKQIKDKWSFLL